MWRLRSVLCFSLMLQAIFCLTRTHPAAQETLRECKDCATHVACICAEAQATGLSELSEEEMQTWNEETTLEVEVILMRSGIKEVVIFSDTTSRILPEDMIIQEQSCHEFDMSTFTQRPHYTVIIDCKDEFELDEGYTFDSISEIFLPNDFVDFGNIELFVGTIPYEPFVIVDTNSTGSTYGGYSIEILNILASELKFRYRIIDFGGAWGHIDENGSWTGSVRGLILQEIDMVVSALSVTAERERVIDFSYLIWEQTTGGLLLTQEEDQFAVFKPLHQFVWLTLVSVAILTGFTALCFERCDQLLRGDRDGSLSFCVRDAREYMWYTYGAMVYQGGVSLRLSSPNRILLSSFWLCVIVLMLTYCSQLMSFLAVTQKTLPFTTLDEAVQARDYALRINTCSLYTTLFQANNGSAFPGVWERAVEDPETSLCGVDLQEAIMEMFQKNQKAVLIAMSGPMKSIAVNSGYCNWGFLKERIFTTGMAIGLPQHTPFKDRLDATIVSLHEAGIIERLRNRYFGLEKGDVCDPDSQAIASHLGLYSVWPLFAILGLGALLAGISLIIEVYRP